MSNSVKTMLDNMYDAFYQKFKEPHKSWDCFIDFLMADHNPAYIYQFNHKFEWLFEDSKLIKAIQHTYNPFTLIRDYYDHLGEMYKNNVVSKTETENKYFLAPTHIAEEMAKMSIPQHAKSLSILDPASGSGRLLMAAHKYSPKATLFGVDSKIRNIRIAMTNFAIHGIPGYFLNADRLLHEIDISTFNGKYNWQFANRWHSHMHQLKPPQIIKPETTKTIPDNGDHRK